MPYFKSKRIEDPRKRKSAFCKKKKDILKRVIDISKSCDLQVFLAIYDPISHEMTQYSSSSDFSIKKVIEAREQAKKADCGSSLEKFTNQDSDNLTHLDFRRVRYQRSKLFSGGSNSSEEDQTAQPIKRAHRQDKKTLTHTASDSDTKKSQKDPSQSASRYMLRSQSKSGSSKDSTSQALKNGSSNSQSSSDERRGAQSGRNKSTYKLGASVIHSSNHESSDQMLRENQIYHKNGQGSSLSSIRTVSPESDEQYARNDWSKESKCLQYNLAIVEQQHLSKSPSQGSEKGIFSNGGEPGKVGQLEAIQAGMNLNGFRKKRLRKEHRKR